MALREFCQTVTSCMYSLELIDSLITSTALRLPLRLPWLQNSMERPHQIIFQLRAGGLHGSIAVGGFPSCLFHKPVYGRANPVAVLQTWYDLGYKRNSRRRLVFAAMRTYCIISCSMLHIHIHTCMRPSIPTPTYTPIPTYWHTDIKTCRHSYVHLWDWNPTYLEDSRCIQNMLVAFSTHRQRCLSHRFSNHSLGLKMSVNYNDFTTTSLGIIVNKGNHPLVWAYLKLVNYSTLPSQIDR